MLTRTQWRGIFAGLTIQVSDAEVSLFDHPQLIDVLVNYSNERFAAENINFLRDIYRWAMNPKVVLNLGTSNGQYLLNTYINKGSPQEINVDEALLINIREQGSLKIDHLHNIVREIISVIKTNDIFMMKSDEVSKNAIDLFDVTNKLVSVAPSLSEEFALIANSKEMPRLEVKMKLMEIINNCKNVEDKEALQRAVSILDDIIDRRWNPAEEFNGLNNKVNPKFKETTTKMFQALKDCKYDAIVQEGHEAVSDFQQKSMLAIQLASLVASNATAKINDHQSALLIQLMEEFRASIDDPRVPVNLVLDGMKNHLQDIIRQQPHKTSFFNKSTLFNNLENLSQFCEFLMQEAEAKGLKKGDVAQSSSRLEKKG